MANPQAPVPTGGRADLKIDPSRCLLMRYSDSSCRRCAEACPQAAIELGEGLSVIAERCTGCLLCTAKCPVGALEQIKDFSHSLGQLRRVPDPVLGCPRTSESSHAALACLGGLSEEHLITICHTMPSAVSLNLSACRECPNSAAIERLRQRLARLVEAGLTQGGSLVILADSAGKLRYREEVVGRRDFFKAFSKSLLRGASDILASTAEQDAPPSAYAGKRLPLRRELLNDVRESLPRELEEKVARHFDTRIRFEEACTFCQGCAAICPTGALAPEQPDTPPAFDAARCTGCGVCREFCLEQALQLASPGHAQP